MKSHVQPGAIYLGRDGGCGSLTSPCEVEQQINNFKASDGEALPQTIEFDVYNPQRGLGPVRLRPSRWGDMVTLRLGIDDVGNDSGRTEVKLGKDNQCLRDASMPPATCMAHNEATGPNFNSGWAHVVISYQQFDNAGVPSAHFVVAINEEVYEIDRPTELTQPNYPYANWDAEWATDPGADGWSFEHTSDLTTFGKYIANVRAYSGFYTKAQLVGMLPNDAGFNTYVASLGDPTIYSGAKKEFQDPADQFSPDPDTAGTRQRPYAIAYAKQSGGSNSKTFDFDGSISSALDEMNSYSWNFGDGTPAGSGRFVSHTYTTGGTKSVTLTVTRIVGPQTLTDSQTISINVPGDQLPPPPPSGSNAVFLPFIVR